MASLEVLDLNNMQACQRCNLAIAGRSCVVEGVGPVGAKLFVIGEAPGAVEDYLGIPFANPRGAGNELNKFLQLAGISRDDVYFTNSVKCRPPNNLKPAKDDVHACRGWIDVELARIKPSVIILLGATAMQAFGIKEPIGLVHGQVVAQVNGIRVLAFYYPASVLHNPGLRKTVEADWAKLPGVIAGKQELPTWTTVIGAMKERFKIISFDTETYSLEDKRPICYSYAGRDAAGLHTAVQDHTAIQLSAPTIIGHNLKFDLQTGILSHYERLEDTEVLAYLLNEPAKGLKDLTLKYYGIRPKDAGQHLQDVDDRWCKERIEYLIDHCEDAKKQKKLVKVQEKMLAEEHAGKVYRRHRSLPPMPLPTMADVSKDVLYPYSASDAAWTYLLWEKLRPQLPTSMEYLYDIECKLIPILAKMETTGIKVDRPKLKKLVEQWTKITESLESELNGMGLENPRSHPQVMELLAEDIEDLGAIKYTDTGQYSTDDKVMERLAKAGVPIAAKLREYGKALKLLQFGVSILGKLDSHDILHGEFNQTRTATGRLSSKNPNLQNIPVKGEGKDIRKCFIARPGMTLISADMSQIELRLGAHIANIGWMIQVYKMGKQSLHVATMHRLYPQTTGWSTDQIDKSDLYKASKNTNFCVFYGGGPAKVAETAGVELPLARETYDKWHNASPELRRWWEKLWQQCRAQGYVETLFGRRRYLPDILSTDRAKAAEAERQAGNLPGQGTAADLLKIAMVHITPRLEKIGATILLQVHDELIVECPDNMVAQAEAILQEELSSDRGLKLSVPLKSDIAHGKRWEDWSD